MYPSSWPKPNPYSRPNSIASRISESQKDALYAREITTRALSTILNVRESSLSHLFPGKRALEPNNKPELIAIRKTFRHLQALAVLEKRLSIKEAADIVNLSYRSMARVVQTIRNSGAAVIRVGGVPINMTGGI